MTYHMVNWDAKGFWLHALMGTPLGVSYFFLASGFLLTYAHSSGAERGTFDTRRFWLKRCVRILPVYYLGLVVALPLLIGHGSTPGKTLATLSLLQAWSPSTALYWNYPAWALSALAFFYVVFPAPLLATARTPRRWLWVLAALAWIAATGSGVLYTVLNPDALSHVSAASNATWLNVLRYNPLVRLPEFLLGVLGARLYLRSGGFGRWADTAFGLGAGVLAIGLILVQFLPYPVINNGLLDPVLVVLLAAVASGGRVSRALSHPKLVFLGQSSYCLYMVHAPVIYMARALAPQYRRAPAFMALVIPSTILIALALYSWVERPITASLAERVQRRTADAPSTSNA
jgi:peptidoglycan/LPS O-acetylase OafA/YrhL